MVTGSLHGACFVCFNVLFTSVFCTIDLEDTFITTGGYMVAKMKKDEEDRGLETLPQRTIHSRKVFQYNRFGNWKELPSMLTGRRGHGCSSYRDDDNNIVLLVTGGYNTVDHFLSATEVQITRFSPWKEAAHYPLAVTGLRGATINNVVFMTGMKVSNLKDQF